MSTPSSPVMPSWRTWRQRVAVSALVVLLTACGGGGGSTSSGGVDPTLAAQINDIKPSDDTKVSVFVELAPTAATSAAQLDTDPATLRRQIQEQFLKDLQSAAASRPASAAASGSCHVDVNDLKKRIGDAYMPTSGAAVRIELNACELDVLPTLNNVTVKGVHADIPLDLHASADAHTLALEVQRSFDGTGATTGIANGQSTAWPVLSSGQRADGSGLVIAVLDTGVEERHPALGAKVLKGACFSSSTSNSSSLCPAGVSVDTTTAQAGRSCADSTAWTDRASAIRAGCAHGTSMASVAAMNYGITPSNPANPAHGGVAKGAGILPIQVFSKTGSASIGSSASDLLAAIEWLTKQADNYRAAGKTVVALNMSLGGGRYSSACDNDYVGGLFKTAFANLRAQGILPIAAAGNEGNRNAISFPACVSNAVSVAAAKLNYSGIASYSNFSSQVKLFAPGGDVDGMYAMPTLCASNSSGNFDCWSQNAGTSPATAFVSGAVAALRSAAPTATLADIESALTRDLTNSYPGLAKTMTVGNVTRPALRVTASGKSLLGERTAPTPSTYSIGGAVTGLGSDKTVTLSNSVTRETLSVSTNGSYAFATAVPANGTYQVVVSAQPSGQACTVGNASGTVTAAVTNINVVCSDNTATDGKDNAGGNCVTNSNGAQVCNDTGSGSTTIQYFVLCVFPQTNYQGYAACAPWDGSASNVYGYYGPIRSLWVRSITYNTANYKVTLGDPITATDQFKVTLQPMTSKTAAVVTRSSTDLQSQLPTNALVRQVILEKP